MQLNELIDRVIAKLNKREDEEMGRFGLDIDQTIYSAMEQYRDIVNDTDPLLVRVKALTWSLNTFANLNLSQKIEFPTCINQ